MKFRPCIDLKNGKVVQIVGGTLKDDDSQTVTNFESEKSSSYFAELYAQHVIALGPNNQHAAKEALHAYPKGLHFGGGVNLENAQQWLNYGASHVIVTSYVFYEGKLDLSRLEKLVKEIGKEHLVLDLSCRKTEQGYVVVTDRWQKFTDFMVNAETLTQLAEYCDEYLIHGVDVEGLQSGIEDDLVELLGQFSPLPVTYAGGARSLDDLTRVHQLGQGKVDLTIGSALDIFGGPLPFEEVLAWKPQ
jgi:phosphoribosylformimino-5-aminoimidazole carboxamide ribotide isomerase